MLSALLALSLGANAATLYVNGTPVEGLRDFEFTNVTVQVDENGDVFIIAPQYNVSLGDAAEAKNKKRRKNKDVTTPPAPTGDGSVAANRWWLISDDNQTAGHVVDVTINDTVVSTFKSAGKQLIMDIGPYLNAGDNTVKFVSRVEIHRAGERCSCMSVPDRSMAGASRRMSPRSSSSATRPVTLVTAWTSSSRSTEPTEHCVFWARPDILTG